MKRILSDGYNFKIGKCGIRFDKTNVILDNQGVNHNENFTIVFPKTSWLKVAQQIIAEYKKEQESLK